MGIKREGYRSCRSIDQGKHQFSISKFGTPPPHTTIIQLIGSETKNGYPTLHHGQKRPGEWSINLQGCDFVFFFTPSTGYGVLFISPSPSLAVL